MFIHLQVVYRGTLMVINRCTQLQTFYMKGTMFLESIFVRSAFILEKTRQHALMH